ncbi:roadblock/LC7 domain-containing protein [Catellatospora bangladeshensis]|uniref:Dynein regulation protein LC7 n=1 Tax=Catellatospora bangladeshensis TaxID=310355 RepID=A0A8J3JR66_9ACTN|nr:MULTISPECIES: roadblock/LC7 domain-containing protein [Catellatospora]BCJ77569.1 dynein regulation protein LC7 [Catellatospora sp. IY07-71]GIF81729.1 dynein regulation protein LC7 [Catellatospora bangladeshensis]
MTTAMLSKPAQDLNWLVAGFADRVPGARHAVVASSDGLVVAVSANLDRATADQLAAITSGLLGIAGCVSQLSDGDEVRQTVIEMARGYFLTMAIRDGSVLAVIADNDADLGVVGFEMARLAKQTGEILTPALRAELQRALPR